MAVENIKNPSVTVDSLSIVTAGEGQDKHIVSISGYPISGSGGGGVVTYTGEDGVTVAGNTIKLDSSAYSIINSVDGIATDVASLKTASSNWDKVGDKLDSTSAAQTYLTKADAATTYQPTGNYLVANDITGKLDKSIYEGASGNWEKSYEVLTAYSAAGKWLTAHQSLSDYYTKSDTSGKDELATEFAKYQVTGEYATTGELDTASSFLSGAVDYVSANAGKTYTQGTGIEINANNVVSISAEYVTAITSVSGITADVNTLKTASSNWNKVSAKVDKPNTATTPELNNNYLIYSTLTGAGNTTGWMPLSANYYSKTESDGRYAKASAALTSVSANAPLSGNGTTANPLGLDLTNAYTIDGTNGIMAVPNSTTNKVVVQMTNDVWTDVQHLHNSASIWDNASAVSAKSTVNITSAGVATVVNSSGTTTNNLVQYNSTLQRPMPKMLLCASADTWSEIVDNVLPAASGMGCLIFVLEPH